MTVDHSSTECIVTDPKAAKRAYDRARYLRRRAERDADRPADPISVIDEPTAAYLAGLTDGDGSIYVTRTNRLRTVYPAVSWAMTHKPTIEWVGSILGLGAVVHNNHTNLRTGETTWGRSSFKVQWRVSVAGTRAVLLCRRMLPYLRTKREQAELVLQFPADERRAPGVRLSEEVRARRIELGDAISKLNRG
ncbi:hypothetical protein ABZY58_12025 [Micromonospora tulbaghiae]|uniref:hypothetical protein n=1 Tax=Micromonospora tulbaghiae TaxID=479978 RepID=UPI0033BC27F5